jgi:hypothetical protein
MSDRRHHPQVIRAKELAREAGLDPYARINERNGGRSYSYQSFMDAAFDEHFARVAIDNIFWDRGGSFYTDRWDVPRRDGDCHFWYGRCKSGSRWFWCARGWVQGHSFMFDADAFKAHGYAATEAEALTAGTAAIKRFSVGRRAIGSFQHGTASYALKQINKAKQTARLAAHPSSAKGSKAVEYLYSRWGGDEFRITKKTAKRIYYVKEESGFSPQIGIAARHRVANDWPPTWRHLYELEDRVGRRNAPEFFLKPCPPGFHDNEPPPIIDLHQLKAEMAAAHPDRGGSSAAFIEARRRYLEARRRVEG